MEVQECLLSQVISGNVDLNFTRSFLNNSAGAITINEIGIYCCLVLPCMIVHDVVAGGQSVAVGQTLTVEYTLRTTV